MKNENKIIDNFAEHEMHKVKDPNCSTCATECAEDPGEYIDQDREERAALESDLDSEFDTRTDV